MVKVDADPLDGPTIDSSKPVDSVMSMGMYIVGAGVFFALLTAAQNTTQPFAQSVMNMVPGVNAGGSSTSAPLDGGGF